MAGYDRARYQMHVWKIPMFSALRDALLHGMARRIHELDQRV
jgi:hypothetical protein